MVEEARQGLLDKLRRHPLEVLEAIEDGTTPLLMACREGHVLTIYIVSERTFSLISFPCMVLDYETDKKYMETCVLFHAKQSHKYKSQSRIDQAHCEQIAACIDPNST